MCAGTRVSQKRVSDSPELEFQRIMCELTWLLGTKHRSSVRRASVLMIGPPLQRPESILKDTSVLFLFLCIDDFILLTHPSKEE